MKTAIWALTIIITALLVLGFLLVRDMRDPPEAGRSIDSGQATRPRAGASCETPLDWSQAAKRDGETLAVIGPVVQTTTREEVRGKPTFIDIGNPFPSKRRMTLVVWGRDREAFGAGMLSSMPGRTVCAVGEISIREGVPQIEVHDAGQLVFNR